MLEIESKNEHLVFVYGSLKKNFGNHHFLEKSNFLLSTSTTHEKYEMYSYGHFPAVVEVNNGYKIFGEVYLIDEQTLSVLDRLEGNGFFYERKLVSCEGVNEKVWMYLLLGQPPNSLNNVALLKDDNNTLFWKMW